MAAKNSIFIINIADSGGNKLLFVYLTLFLFIESIKTFNKLCCSVNFLLTFQNFGKIFLN